MITASAAITVDSTSIVYVGYTNSSGNYFLGAVRICLAIHILHVTYNTLCIPSSTSRLPHFYKSQEMHSIQALCHLL